ncbi:MAG: hypothetical protein K0U59_08460 [Gammaproteobacteria bacterium]|nr:hypothetical protein [Gammaproteobacteria bacterium]
MVNSKIYKLALVPLVFLGLFGPLEISAQVSCSMVDQGEFDDEMDRINNLNQDTYEALSEDLTARLGAGVADQHVQEFYQGIVDDLNEQAQVEVTQSANQALNEENANQAAVKARIDVLSSAWKDATARLLRENNLNAADWVLDIKSTRPSGEAWSVNLVNTETQEIKTVVASDPVFDQFQKLVEEHFSTLKPTKPAPSNGSEVTPFDIDGVDSLSEAFFVQYLMNLFKHKKASDNAEAALHVNLQKALQIQAWIRIAQLVGAETQKVIKVASIVKILKGGDAADEVLKNAGLSLKSFKVAGNVLAGADILLNAANVGFDIYELSVANTELLKSTAGTQLAFDAVSLGLSGTFLATTALSSSSSATAAAIAAAAAPVTEVLGPLAVPLAGVGIGVTALTQAFEENLNKVKDTGIYFSQLDVDYSSGGFSYLQGDENILDFAHVGLEEKDGKKSYTRYNQAIINSIDLRNHQLTFGSQKTWPTQRCEDAGDNLLSAFAPNPRALKQEPMINIREGIDHGEHLGFTPQENIVLPVTLPANIDYDYQMAWVLYRHDTGFDVARRLEKNACFIFDYYMSPSQRAINSLTFIYDNQHEVEVFLDEKPHTLINMGAPVYWQGKTLYKLYGAGGKYTLSPANQGDRYSIYRGKEEGESWTIDASFTNASNIRQGADHGSDYSEFMIGKTRVWISGDQWVYVHTKDSQKDEVSVLMKINGKGEIITVEEQVDYNTWSTEHPQQALSEYLQDVKTVQGNHGTIRVDNFSQEVGGLTTQTAWYVPEDNILLYPQVPDHQISGDTKNDMQLLGYWKRDDKSIESWYFSLSRGTIFQTVIQGDSRKTLTLEDQDLGLGFLEGTRQASASPEQVQLLTANGLLLEVIAEPHGLSAVMSGMLYTGEPTTGSGVFDLHAALMADIKNGFGNSAAAKQAEMRAKEFLNQLTGQRTTKDLLNIDIYGHRYWYITKTAQFVMPGAKWWQDDQNIDSRIPPSLVSWQGTGDQMKLFWYAPVSASDTSQDKGAQHGRLYYQQGNHGKAVKALDQNIVTVYNSDQGVVAVTSEGKIYLINAENQHMLIGLTADWLAKHIQTPGNSLKMNLDVLLKDNTNVDVLNIKYVRNTAGDLIDGWYDTRANALVFASAPGASTLRYLGYDQITKQAWLFAPKAGKVYRAAGIELKDDTYPMEGAFPQNAIDMTSKALFSAYPESPAFMLFDGQYKNGSPAPTLSVVKRSANISTAYAVYAFSAAMLDTSGPVVWTQGAPGLELKTDIKIDNAYLSDQSLLLSHQDVLYQYQRSSNEQGAAALSMAGIAWPALINPLQQCTGFKGGNDPSKFQQAILDVEKIDGVDKRIECLSSALSDHSVLTQSNDSLPVYDKNQAVVGWYDGHEKAFIPYELGVEHGLRYLGSTVDDWRVLFDPNASVFSKGPVIYKKKRYQGYASSEIIAPASDAALKNGSLSYLATKGLDELKAFGVPARNVVFAGMEGNDRYIFNPDTIADTTTAYIVNYAADEARDILDLRAFSVQDFTVFVQDQDLVFQYHNRTDTGYDFYIVVQNQVAADGTSRWQHIEVEFNEPLGLFWIHDIAAAIQSSGRHYQMEIDSGKLLLDSGWLHTAFSVESAIKPPVKPESSVQACNDNRLNC